MFNFLVTRSLRKRLVVLAISAVLILYGRLPVDVFPDLNRPTVTIMTEAEGIAPPEVEQLVTYPIETQMNGLPGVTRVRSTSGGGLSIVYVEFDRETDIYRNRQQIAERLGLGLAQLPDGAVPQMGPIASFMGRILLIALTGPDDVSAMELRESADFTIRPRLLAIPGVANGIPIGCEMRQYRVAPNASTLRALRVSFEEVEAALANFGATPPEGVKADNILFLFLLNTRTTAVSVTVIPATILVSAIVFHRMGLSINTMTLGGLAIAIGELMDDAVFDVVVSASKAARSGIVYATMIIVLVFVPLFAVPGIEGRLFAPLGQACIISILASLVVFSHRHR